MGMFGTTEQIRPCSSGFGAFPFRYLRFFQQVPLLGAPAPAVPTRPRAHSKWCFPRDFGFVLDSPAGPLPFDLPIPSWLCSRCVAQVRLPSQQTLTMQKKTARKKILAYADASGSLPFALAGSMIGVKPLAAAAADNHNEVNSFDLNDILSFHRDLRRKLIFVSICSKLRSDQLSPVSSVGRAQDS